MNVGWTNTDLSRCAPCEDVRDLSVSTFCDIRSASIQELVYQIGVRVLESFEQIAAVDFYAENRLWDSAQTADGAAVYTDARPPFGVITLTLER
jgi:urate oxidase